ncbi:retrovirus-related pol polyprotein from transposon TNT 1-94 [Tanacetum coccineum]
MKVKESTSVTFNESPPPTKLLPLVDDDVGEEEAIENNTKVVNNSNKEDESIEVDEVINIKDSKNHPLEQVIELKNVNEALGDESWVIAMQEELNQFVANDVWDLVPLPMSQIVIGTKWVFRNKLDENGEIMPQLNHKDYQRTKAYLPRIHRSKAIDEEVREFYRGLESRLFHEGRFVTPSFIEANKLFLTFQAVGLKSFLTLDEPIFPRFITQFYHSLEVKRYEENNPYI